VLKLTTWLSYKHHQILLDHIQYTLSADHLPSSTLPVLNSLIEILTTLLGHLQFKLVIYVVFYFIFHFPSKTGQQTITKIGGKMIIAREKLRPNFSKIHWGGVWRQKHFTTFIIDGLTNQQPWTKIIDLTASGVLTLGPAPYF